MVPSPDKRNEVQHHIDEQEAALMPALAASASTDISPSTNRRNATRRSATMPLPISPTRAKNLADSGNAGDQCTNTVGGEISVIAGGGR